MQRLLAQMQQEVSDNGPQTTRRTVAGYNPGLSWPNSRDWHY
jgi:hypothetical protein